MIGAKFLKPFGLIECYRDQQYQEQPQRLKQTSPTTESAASPIHEAQHRRHRNRDRAE